MPILPSPRLPQACSKRSLSVIATYRVPQTFSLSISERSTHLSRSRRLPHMSTAPAAPIVSLEHVRSHRGLPTAAIVGTSLWVGSAALVCGLLLLRRQSTRGPPHPFTSALVSGLLIGTSCLVVLPEALDSLPAAGWTSSQVLLLFLSSAALMFFLDHAVMEHQHVGPGAVSYTHLTLPTRDDV